MVERSGWDGPWHGMAPLILYLGFLTFLLSVVWLICVYCFHALTKCGGGVSNDIGSL